MKDDGEKVFFFSVEKFLRATMERDRESRGCSKYEHIQFINFNVKAFLSCLLPCSNSPLGWLFRIFAGNRAQRAWNMKNCVQKKMYDICCHRRKRRAQSFRGKSSLSANVWNQISSRHWQRPHTSTLSLVDSNVLIEIKFVCSGWRCIFTHLSRLSWNENLLFDSSESQLYSGKCLCKEKREREKIMLKKKELGM